MAEYDFECRGCGRTVTIQATIREKEAGLKCPECKSSDLVQIFTPISTLGGCADSPTFAPG